MNLNLVLSLQKGLQGPMAYRVDEAWPLGHCDKHLLSTYCVAGLSILWLMTPGKEHPSLPLFLQKMV